MNGVLVFLIKKNYVGRKMTGEELSNHLTEYSEHLSELKDLLNQASNSGLTVSALAYLFKKRTPVGLLLSVVGKIAAMDIPEHEKELLMVTIRYVKMHSNDPSNMEGVYSIKQKTGSLLLPGSGTFIINYYDVKTGKYLGGIGKAETFLNRNSVKQEKYVD